MAPSKAYHTEALIEAPPEEVWSVLTDFGRYPEWNPLVGRLEGDFERGGSIEVFIIPLGRSFAARLTAVRTGEELTWIGTLLGSWFLWGEHYYRLRPEGEARTRLLHGERFGGVASRLIGRRLLTRMEEAFVAHNHALKDRVEQASRF